MSPFETHRSRLMTFYAAADFREALAVALSAHAECPEEHARTWYWRACLHSLLGDASAALHALREGLDEGIWFDPRMLDTDTDLDSLRSLAAFAEIRAESERRRVAYQASARPECMVLSPAGAVWEQRSLLVLHRRGDTARSFVEHWRPLVDEGWTLVAPQSSQACDAATFCWDDTDLALMEIRQHLDDCRRLRGMDLGGMVIAGASQGARLALELAIEAGLPALCVIPTFPEGYDVSRLTSMAGHAPAGFILGERDPANERVRQVTTALESAGVALAVREMKGVRHDLPEGFASIAGELLRQLVDPAAAE